MLCEASFYRIVLTFLKAYNKLKIHNFDAFACTINSLIKDSMEKEFPLTANKIDSNLVLLKIINNEDIKYTLLKINILKLMLEYIVSNKEIIDKYPYLKTHYSLIVFTIDNIISKLNVIKLPTIVSKK